MTLHGDINQDGRIDRQDLTLLKNLIGASGGNPDALNHLPPEVLDKLDVNGDGQIDSDDVNAMCQTLFMGSVDKTASFRGKLDELRAKSRQ